MAEYSTSDKDFRIVMWVIAIIAVFTLGGVINLFLGGSKPVAGAGPQPTSTG